MLHHTVRNKAGTAKNMMRHACPDGVYETTIYTKGMEKIQDHSSS